MRFVFLFLIPVFSYAFQNKPYFSPLAEFELYSAYTYSYYNSVEGLGIPYRSRDSDVDLNLGLRFLPDWEMQVEGEFLKTSHHVLSAESFAGQVRYHFLDDLSGDAVSLTSGLRLRYVTGRFLHDLSCPYAATLNLDLVTSIGKEFNRGDQWICRIFSYLGAGIGNRGAPYLTPELHLEFNVFRRHQFDFFALGNFGFGGRSVSVKQFGYGNTEHYSVDVGATYRYVIPIWGELYVTYTYRPYAHQFPQRMQTFLLGYHLPFSLF
ncbi:MAG: hypothetical protein KBC64_00970 [Simkaniaceae bacterium]|nr:hypothetical protein [Simkaniaceae bacterium]